MSKKKSNPKKHKFKYSDSSGSPQLSPLATQTSKSAIAGPAVASVAGRDFSYVAVDVRRIGVMVVGLIAVELAFYYALVFTPFGAAVYRLVNV